LSTTSCLSGICISGGQQTFLYLVLLLHMRRNLELGLSEIVEPFRMKEKDMSV
jgi:hypothetical protein